MKDGSPNDIVESVVCPQAVTLTLRDGTAIYLSSNTGYLHLHFSGLGEKQLTASVNHLGQIPEQELKLANYVNLFMAKPPPEEDP
jgi:hypothetical protein